MGTSPKQEIITTRGEKSEDITGRKYGKWTVKKFHGRRIRTTPKGRVSVELWECECACGNKGIVLKPNLVHARSTQCVRCQAKERSGHADPDALPRRNMKVTWKRTPDLCEAWQDYPTFWAWVKTQNRPSHSKLLRRDESKPHSPENSYFGNDREVYEAALALIAKTEEWTPEEARAWAASVARQRVYDAAKKIRERQKAINP